MTSQSNSFLFGGHEFPAKSMNSHLFFLGATGSGKSVSIQASIQDFVGEIGVHAHDGGYRALIYDSKLDVLPWLWQLEDRLTCRIVITNPFDVRSSAWDLSRDVTSHAAAYEVASILCPINEDSAQKFWDYACLNIVCGILKAVHVRSPNSWTLRHVALIARSEHHMRELFSQSASTRHLVSRYLQDGKLSQSVLATLDTKLEPFAITASLWHNASSSFSLREFVAGESIIVLSNNEEARAPIDALNRCIFQRLTQLLLAQPDSQSRKTLIALDELREAGTLDGLRSLSLRGRSKGVVIAAGAQDLEGLEDRYGEKVAREILGQMAFLAILRLQSPSSAKYASSVFGPTEVKEKSRQSSTSIGGADLHYSRGVSETLRERETVLPNEIMNLHPTSASEGIEGFYKTPFGGFRNDYDFVRLLYKRSDGRKAPENYGFIARPESEQILEDWTPEELQRFGLTPIPPDEPPSSSRQRDRPQRPRDRNPRRRNQPREDPVDRDQEPDDDGDDDM